MATDMTWQVYVLDDAAAVTAGYNKIQIFRAPITYSAGPPKSYTVGTFTERTSSGTRLNLVSGQKFYTYTDTDTVPGIVDGDAKYYPGSPWDNLSYAFAYRYQLLNTTTSAVTAPRPMPFFLGDWRDGDLPGNTYENTNTPGETNHWNRASWHLADAQNTRQTIETDVTTTSGKYLKATVLSGDVDPNNPGGAQQRSEVVYYYRYHREGDSIWARWKVKFPTGMPIQNTNNKWHVVGQWHQSDAPVYVGDPTPVGDYDVPESWTHLGPPIAFEINQSRYRLRCLNAIWDRFGTSIDPALKPNNTEGVIWQEDPFPTGVWREFLLNIVWSTSNTKAALKLWIDGDLAASAQPGDADSPIPFGNCDTWSPTMNYSVTGLYRSNLITDTEYVQIADYSLFAEDPRYDATLVVTPPTPARTTGAKAKNLLTGWLKKTR